MKKVMLSLVSATVGAVAGAAAVSANLSGEKEKIQQMSDKHFALFILMNQWVKVKQEGKNLASYFEVKGYRKIAIYGMSYAGETLVDELKDTDIKVVYGIDKKADSIYSDIEIVSLEDELEDVDAVVVTAITFFDEIEENLSDKVDCPIISLEDVLYDI